MVVIYCYFERQNYKFLKFLLNKPTYFEEVRPSFKRRLPIITLKLGSQISVGRAY